jgi:predicted PurR-regulated permease PerM
MTASRQLLWFGGGLVAFMALIWLFNAILAPFVIGMAIAYFLDPVCDRLESVGLSRTFATLIVTLAFLILLAVLVALIAPLVVGEIIQLAGQLPDWFERLRVQVTELGESLQTQVEPAVMEQIRSVVVGSKERLASWATGLARDVLSGGFALFNVISLLLITPIVAFYLLRDWDRLLSEGDKLLPPAYAETIREQLREVDRTLSGFVRGTGTVCIALGTYYAIGLSIAGLDFGLVIGLTAGLISFVPYLGATLGLLAAVGTALVQFDGYLMAIVVAAIFLFGQFVEGNILQPTLVGERVRLHPVWVIFALLAGGLLFGFAGVLLAVPTAAVIGVLVRFAVGQYRQKVLAAPAAPTADSTE